MPVVHCRRPAMGTWFELWLVGDDAENLAAIGEAVLDDIQRTERLLSRFDPAAEVARLNRQAASGVRVSPEMLDILNTCRDWAERTAGAFDPCAPTGRMVRDLSIDAPNRTVRYEAPAIRLDFGGFGKGYALDLARRTLKEYGVGSALLHGGTSSVLALGRDEQGRPWSVGLRDPFAAVDTEIERLELSDRGLSCSATFAPGSERSDLIDPETARPLERAVACAVIASEASKAEILSTALLVMGREPAARYVAAGAGGMAPCRVAWIEQNEGRTVLQWWTTGGREIA